MIEKILSMPLIVLLLIIIVVLTAPEDYLYYIWLWAFSMYILLIIPMNFGFLPKALDNERISGNNKKYYIDKAKQFIYLSPLILLFGVIHYYYIKLIYFINNDFFQISFNGWDWIYYTLSGAIFLLIIAWIDFAIIALAFKISTYRK